jgi:hypothetical protein
MSFDVEHETATKFKQLQIVGIGVILSCLCLSGLFGWGIYLDLNKQPCECSCDK